MTLTKFKSNKTTEANASSNNDEEKGFSTCISAGSDI